MKSEKINKEKEKIANMFSTISPVYDRLNDLLSFYLHRGWKNKLISKIPTNSLVLDIATGTGDIAHRLYKKSINVIAIDISQEMINLAKKRNEKIDFRLGSAEDLTCFNQKFDYVTISYGIRNFENFDIAMGQIFNILKPNGSLLILESGMPKGLLKIFYKFHTKLIIPILAKFLTPDKNAYKYLIESIEEFPYGEELTKKIINNNSYSSFTIKKVFFGSSYIYQFFK